MTIPTEPIGSIPRPPALVQAIAAADVANRGSSPLGADTSTSRDQAFAEFEARVVGTAIASKALGVG
jgi:hypothetical protein